MCTRGATSMPTSSEHPGSPKSSNPSSPVDSYEKSGPYGPYNTPILPPSAEMRAIVGDAMSMAGGVAAVLLQIAQPGVGAGVAANSSFTVRPVERGRRSIIYIYVQAFGTEEEKRYITDATHRSHAKINGPGYDANDVDLQLWVAATTYWSLIVSYEMIYGPLKKDVAERVYLEFSSMATALHVPASKWPNSLSAFDEYFHSMLRTLSVTKEAKEVGGIVLNPSKGLLKWKWLHLWLYTVINGPVSRIITAEVMPDEVRGEFGLKRTKRTRAMFALWKGSMKLLWRPQPRRVREVVKDYYMWDMRNRIKDGRRW